MKLTQKKRVIEKLKSDEFVDNFWAMETKTTIRLGAIIFELKAEGWIFDDEKSGFIDGTKNWRYYLAKERQPYMPKYRYVPTENGMLELPL